MSPSSSPRTALIAGSTGLVGRACLAALLRETAYGTIVAFVRTPVAFSHPKLQIEIVDLGTPGTFPEIRCDDVFCALGTTIARAGSREAFRAVDHDAVVAVAKAGLRGGATRMTLVSSVGADRARGNFYLRVKADTEAALSALPFRALHILRPGLLLGHRAETRPAESVAAAVAPALNLLLQGPLRRYRAIEAECVGRAMVSASLDDVEGRRVLHYDEITRAAARR